MGLLYCTGEETPAPLSSLIVEKRISTSLLLGAGGTQNVSLQEKLATAAKRKRKRKIVINIRIYTYFYIFLYNNSINYDWPKGV